MSGKNINKFDFGPLYLDVKVEIENIHEAGLTDSDVLSFSNFIDSIDKQKINSTSNFSEICDSEIKNDTSKKTAFEFCDAVFRHLPENEYPYFCGKSVFVNDEIAGNFLVNFSQSSFGIQISFYSSDNHLIQRLIKTKSLIVRNFEEKLKQRVAVNIFEFAV